MVRSIIGLGHNSASRWSRKASRTYGSSRSCARPVATSGRDFSSPGRCRPKRSRSSWCIRRLTSADARAIRAVRLRAAWNAYDNGAQDLARDTGSSPLAEATPSMRSSTASSRGRSTTAMPRSSLVADHLADEVQPIAQHLDETLVDLVETSPGLLQIQPLVFSSPMRRRLRVRHAVADTSNECDLDRAVVGSLELGAEPAHVIGDHSRIHAHAPECGAPALPGSRCGPSWRRGATAGALPGRTGPRRPRRVGTPARGDRSRGRRPRRGSRGCARRPGGAARTRDATRAPHTGWRSDVVGDALRECVADVAGVVGPDHQHGL